MKQYFDIQIASSEIPPRNDVCANSSLRGTKQSHYILV